MDDLVRLTKGIDLPEHDRDAYVKNMYSFAAEHVHKLATSSNAQERSRLQAELFGGLLGPLAMIDTTVPLDPTNLDRTITHFEQALPETESRYRLYNRFGGHPVIRLMDAVVDNPDQQSPAAVKDAAVQLLRASVLIVRQASEQ